MADDSVEGVSRVRFRDDILRGVRLFAIVFAVILIAVWIYRTVRAQSDVRGASPDLSGPPETAQPLEQKVEPASAPDSEAVAETHGLMVPPPPTVAGTPAPGIARQRVAAKPTAKLGAKLANQPARAVASSNYAPAPPGRDFESSHPIALPGEPAGEPSEQSLSKQGVGYKSLLELNSNHAAVVQSVQPPAEDSTEQPAKGNRFLKAVGKIFRAGGRKETAPLALQQSKQP